MEIVKALMSMVATKINLLKNNVCTLDVGVCVCGGGGGGEGRGRGRE